VEPVEEGRRHRPAHDSKFTIVADLKEYEHRVPLSSISHFSIDGDAVGRCSRKIGLADSIS
jgi:hypothetical protein